MAKVKLLEGGSFLFLKDMTWHEITELWYHLSFCLYPLSSHSFDYNYSLIVPNPLVILGAIPEWHEKRRYLFSSRCPWASSVEVKRTCSSAVTGMTEISGEEVAFRGAVMTMTAMMMTVRNSLPDISVMLIIFLGIAPSCLDPVIYILIDIMLRVMCNSPSDALTSHSLPFLLFFYSCCLWFHARREKKEKSRWRR